MERTQAFPARCTEGAAPDDDDSTSQPDTPLNQFHQSEVVRHHGVGFPSSEVSKLQFVYFRLTFAPYIQSALLGDEFIQEIVQNCFQ